VPRTRRILAKDFTWEVAEVEVGSGKDAAFECWPQLGECDEFNLLKPSGRCCCCFCFCCNCYWEMFK